MESNPWKYNYVVPQGRQDCTEEFVCSTDQLGQIHTMNKMPDPDGDPGFKVEYYNGTVWTPMARNEWVLDGRTLLFPAGVAFPTGMAQINDQADASSDIYMISCPALISGITADQYRNYYAIIYDGTGAGQVRRIISNTAAGAGGTGGTDFYIYETFQLAPDATSLFRITNFPNIHIAYRLKGILEEPYVEFMGYCKIVGGIGNTGPNGTLLTWDLGRKLSRGTIKHVHAYRISGDAQRFSLELRNVAGAAGVEDNNRVFNRDLAVRTIIDETAATMGEIPYINQDYPNEQGIYYYLACDNGTVDTEYRIMGQLAVSE